MPRDSPSESLYFVLSPADFSPLPLFFFSRGGCEYSKGRRRSEDESLPLPVKSERTTAGIRTRAATFSPPLSPFSPSFSLFFSVFLSRCPV